MNNYAKLKNGLTTLSLYFFRDSLDSYIELVSNGNKSIVDALYELVSIELQQQQFRAINSCVKTANFPFFKTMDTLILHSSQE